VLGTGGTRWAKPGVGRPGGPPPSGNLGARLAEVDVISAAERCTFYQELSRCQESETALVIDHLPGRRIP
jgi:hypothetical protein